MALCTLAARVCDIHIVLHTHARTHTPTHTSHCCIDFQSSPFVIPFCCWSSGCCYEECYCTHPRIVYASVLLGCVPRTGINGAYVLHIPSLVDTLTDANLPSARSIQLMFIRIENSVATLVLTSSTWRSLRSPGVSVCWTIHSGDGPGRRQEDFI